MSTAFDKLTVKFRKGEVVFHENDLGTEMFIIQAGTVAVDKKIGGMVRRLAVFGKGDFFGEMSLLEYAPRTATVTALEDCELVKIDGSTFDQMIRSNTEIAIRMLRKFSVRLREMDKKLEALLLDRADEKPILIDAHEAVSPQTAAPGGPQLAVLINEQTHQEYPIHSAEALIGRADPVTGIIPDVDLTNEENGRSVSRRHARLLFRGGQIQITEEVGALNGTCVNGRRIRPGVLTPVADGDRLLLGMIPLKLTVSKL